MIPVRYDIEERDSGELPECDYFELSGAQRSLGLWGLREEVEFDCSDDRTSEERQFPKAPRVAAVDSTGQCRFVAETMVWSIFGRFYGRRRGMELKRVGKMGQKL